MELVILAGGKGTRLKDRLGDKPKPLIEIANRPLLDYHLSLAEQFNIKTVHLLIGYGAQYIKNYCGDGSYWGLNIVYHEETAPLGTAGAVLSILDKLPQQFLVMYGDTLLDVDLKKMLFFHEQKKAAITLFLHPNDHPADSDLVEIDDHNRVIAIHPYPHNKENFLPNLASAALYAFEKSALSVIKYADGMLDFGKQVFPKLIKLGCAIYGYKCIEYIKDIGTSERVDAVTKDFLSGKIEKRRLDIIKSAIFLDRDGTINCHNGYVKSKEQFMLLPGAAQAIREINLSEYLSVIVTNQPVIARGDTTTQELSEIHNKMDTLLGEHGAFIDALYYCPHHPDRGFSKERLEYKICCDCRKPNIAMLKTAQRDLNIDFSTSWLIGDSMTDVECARRADVKSILLRSGEPSGSNKFYCLPDIECSDLLSAVRFILRDWARLVDLARSLVRVVKPGNLILVGGLARSGKSCFATALKYALQEKNQRAITVSLDSWLVSYKDRKGVGVLGRYRIDKVEKFIDCFLKTKIKISIPFYDRLKRETYPDRITVENTGEDVVIIEGVLALLLRKTLLERAILKVYVNCSESRRFERFREEYFLRKWKDDSIEREYQLRQQDETPVIKASIFNADHIIQGDL